MNKNADTELERGQNGMTATQNNQPDSITEVNPKRTHGLGIWGNPRVVMGVRVDSELKKRFKSVAKRVFGSTCNPIESFMATVVSCSENGVNFGNTIEVGKIVIERNLRERRRLEIVREEVSEVSVVEKNTCCVCGKAGYRVVTRSDNGRVVLCRIHFEKEKPRLLGWGALNG